MTGERQYALALALLISSSCVVAALIVLQQPNGRYEDLWTSLLLVLFSAVIVVLWRRQDVRDQHYSAQWGSYEGGRVLPVLGKTIDDRHVLEYQSRRAISRRCEPWILYAVHLIYWYIGASLIAPWCYRWLTHNDAGAMATLLFLSGALITLPVLWTIRSRVKSSSKWHWTSWVALDLLSGLVGFLPGLLVALLWFK